MSPADASGVAINRTAAASISLGVVTLYTVDVAGNIVGTIDTTTPSVTVAGVNTTAATLGGTLTRTMSAGSVIFSDLALTPLGVSGSRVYGSDTLAYAPALTSFQLRYSATGLTSVVDTVSISKGAAARLRVSPYAQIAVTATATSASLGTIKVP